MANAILASLRSAESPGVRLQLKREKPTGIALARPLKNWPTPVNVRELAALVGWPLGDEGYPGVKRSGARLLKVADTIPRHGRVVARSSYPGDERSLALNPKDALQHLHVLGPTGVGKSTLLLNLIMQDIGAGREVIMVDPKGDLIEDILSRIPDERLEDVVALDPTDDQRPLGLRSLCHRLLHPASAGRDTARPWADDPPRSSTTGQAALGQRHQQDVEQPLLHGDRHLPRREV